MSYPGGPVPGYYPPADHPQATTALVLGIIGLVVCPLTSPFAWSIGNRAVNEIDWSARTAAPMGGRGQAQAGKILGIIGTVYMICLVLLVIVAIIAVGAASSGSG